MGPKREGTGTGKGQNGGGKTTRRDIKPSCKLNEGEHNTSGKYLERKIGAPVETEEKEGQAERSVRENETGLRQRGYQNFNRSWGGM